MFYFLSSLLLYGLSHPRSSLSFPTRRSSDLVFRLQENTPAGVAGFSQDIDLVDIAFCQFYLKCLRRKYGLSLDDTGVDIYLHSRNNVCLEYRV